MEVTPRVCLLTGASGLLGTRFIERFASRYQIVAVHHRQPVEFASQDQYFVDPLAPDDDVAANDQQPSLSPQISPTPRSAPGWSSRRSRPWARSTSWSAVPSSGTGPRSSLSTTPGWLRGRSRSTPSRPCGWLVQLVRQAWASSVDDNVERNRNIVAVASSAGSFSFYPDLGQGVYAASKAGLIHLAYHLASECWDLGVRVNTVVPDTFPGRVETDDVIDVIVGFDLGSETGRTTTLLGPS